MKLRVLVCESDPVVCKALHDILHAAGCDISVFDTWSAAAASPLLEEPHLVVIRSVDNAAAVEAIVAHVQRTPSQARALVLGPPATGTGALPPAGVFELATPFSPRQLTAKIAAIFGA